MGFYAAFAQCSPGILLFVDATDRQLRSVQLDKRDKRMQSRAVVVHEVGGEQ
jgi:hypothetical protein